MNETYESSHLSDTQISAVALSVIKTHFHGMSVGQVKCILREVELIINSTMMVNCAGEEFQKAVAGFQAADSRPS